MVNGGNIYISTDSGDTWSQKPLYTQYISWYSITSSSDGTKLAAVVNGGYIYASTDSGDTWSQKTLEIGIQYVLHQTERNLLQW